MSVFVVAYGSLQHRSQLPDCISAHGPERYCCTNFVLFFKYFNSSPHPLLILVGVTF